MDNLINIRQDNDFRRVSQPNDEERLKLKYRLYNFSNMRRISKVFKRHPEQIRQAFEGRQPQLMNKLKIYIEKMESRKEQTNSLQDHNQE